MLTPGKAFIAAFNTKYPFSRTPVTAGQSIMDMGTKGTLSVARAASPRRLTFCPESLLYKAID